MPPFLSIELIDIRFRSKINLRKVLLICSGSIYVAVPDQHKHIWKVRRGVDTVIKSIQMLIINLLGTASLKISFQKYFFSDTYF